jgi:hypothetical protein
MTSPELPDVQLPAGLATKIQESPEVASTTWRASGRLEQGFRFDRAVRPSVIPTVRNYQWL